MSARMPGVARRARPAALVNAVRARSRPGVGGRPRGLLAAGLWLAALVVPFVVTSSAWRQIFILMVVYAGLAAGLNLLVGFTGLLDLGYVAFFAVGAYTTAILTTHELVAHFGQAFYASNLWWAPYAATIPAVIFAGFLAGVLGYPTLRARGDYLAIMTLGLGEAVQLVAINWTGLTGGPEGISAIPPFAVGTTQFFNPLAVYYVALAIVAPCLAFVWRVSRSHLGRIWRTVKEDELVAESMGVRAARYKLYAYVAGGGIAGAIGVVFAHSQGFIDPASFTIDVNFVILALIVIGGVGRISGPIIAAIAYVGLSQWLSTTAFVQAQPEMASLVLGALVLIVLIVRAHQGWVGRLWPGRKLAMAAPGTETRPRLTDGDAVDQVGPVAVTERPVLSSSWRPRRGAADSEPGSEPGLRPGMQGLTGQGLCCSFGGIRALDGVDIQVRTGEVLGLIGPNGAGKTTLVNVLTGVQQPTSGCLRIDGSAVAMSRPSDAAKVGISRTFQLIRVLPDMTVLENLLVGGHLDMRRGLGLVLGIRAWSGERRLAGRAMEILAALGLQGQATRLVATLPYGDRRRVEIGRALMAAPRFLFLDEPAAGMDARETSELGTVVRDIRDLGIGVCLIEHDLSLVTSVCDRVVALDRGAVAAEGPPDEVAASPAIARAYLGVEP